MFTPYPADTVQRATTAFLNATERLLGAWADYRAGKAPAAFDEQESDYLEISAALTEMHMVVEPVKKLTGAELIQERDRLANLTSFPHQELIAPVMGAVKHRAEQLKAYATTSAGSAKITQAERQQERARIAREVAEETRQRQLRWDREERLASERRAYAAAQRAENERIRKQIDTCLARESDPEARAILVNWGFTEKRDLAPSNDLWREERLVKGPGLFDVNRLVVDLVVADLAVLSKEQDARAKAAQKHIKPAPKPEERPKPSPRRSSGPSGPGF